MSEHKTEERSDVLVVGAGVSGLAAAWELLRSAPASKVVVAEAGERVGGAATTDYVDGFTIERGPNGVLSNVDHTLGLAREVGLEGEIIAADPAARLRYLYLSSKLRPVPKALPAFDMLGPVGLLRLAGEILVPRRPADAPDESVTDFLARRFGRRAANLLSDIAVSGVSGGDPARTSLAALFPKLAAAEREAGSVIRWGTGRRKTPGPKTALHSLRRGMQSLPDALAERLDVRTNCSVFSLKTEGEEWVAETTAGPLRSRAVVLAVGSDTAGGLLRGVDTELADTLGRIPYAGMRVVSIGVRREQVAHDLAGFGFLVPRGQGLRLLGSVWSSSIFENRAPEGHVLLRVMIGGRMDPTAVEESDADVEAQVLDELGRVIGLSGSPTLVHHTNWRVGIPQYELGHLDRWSSIRARVEQIAGLELCGNAYDGVSVNDCIRYGRSVGRKLAAAVRTD